MRTKYILNIFLTSLALFSFSGGFADELLPENLDWESNDTATVFAASNAKKGGTYRTYMLAFPLTLRQVGPDSNSSFRSYLDGNTMSLMGLHPNTEELLPELATHWAYGGRQKNHVLQTGPKRSLVGRASRHGR